MDLLNLGGLVKDASDALAQWIPTQEDRDKAAAHIADLVAQHKEALLSDRTSVDLAQAANVRAGWRSHSWLGEWPGGVGWTGAAALLWHFVASPIVATFFPGVTVPVLHLKPLLSLLVSMLGVHGISTYHERALARIGHGPR